MGVFVSCSFICCFPPIPTLFANFAPVSGEADLSTSYPRYMGIFLCTYLWRGYICLSSFPITISTLHVSHSIAGTCEIQLHQLPLEWSLVLRLKLGKIGSHLESGRYERTSAEIYRPCIAEQMWPSMYSHEYTYLEVLLMGSLLIRQLRTHNYEVSGSGLS